MTTDASDIIFIVPGQAQPVDSTAATERGAAAGGTVKFSVRVGAQRGGGGGGAGTGGAGGTAGTGDVVRVTARPGEDVVVLTIANGPTLVLHPEDARDLMRAQGAAPSRSAGKAGPANEVAISAQLGWPGLEATATRGATRGWMGQALLSAVEVITGLVKDPVVDLATAAITQKVDGAVEQGVYLLKRDALPPELKGSGLLMPSIPSVSGEPGPRGAPIAAGGGPLLVLIHGTFVDTISTFGKLWTGHPQTVRDLFDHYQDRVYALDHPTMSASPIANALALVNAMPPGARLHLLTHSRGGLVAEVLARACGGATPSEDELALFAEAKYPKQREELMALVTAAQGKGLKVERVVRVACPARGTLLASGRFDAYLSVLQWGLQLTGVTVVANLVAFLHEVARRRADPAELPGLEAMMPGSAVVQWLNGGAQTIPGDLRVVAGDLQGDSIGSWVKTLLSDAFYWTDNDLVVQTRSMYGGTPRAASASAPGASFLLDRGAKVSHFNYFANDRSVAAIARALTDAAPADFAAIGPLSWAGEDAGGSRAAKAIARSRGGPGVNAADRPAVIVLPGILGSHLALDGKRIWLGFRFINGLMKLAWDPATASRVTPDGPIGNSYDDLIERLADSHEVIAFAFDWRRPIEDEARRLALQVDALLAARNTSQRPVRLLAHSMGGLVARTLQLEKPDTWKRMMARDGARVLMLGTPNGGSWSPMQTLSGDDTFGNALVAFGSLFDNSGARQMMACMPGFIQMQAGLLDPALGLDQAGAWKKLADDDMAALRERSIWHSEGPDRGKTQQSIYEWGAPPQGVLDQAVALRRRLDTQADTLGVDAEKMLLVIGHAAFTPAGISTGADGLDYLDAPDDGDGRVTRINAMLPGVRTWKVNAEHGKLPDEASAFAAYIELLQNGDTHLIEAYQPLARGARSADARPGATPGTPGTAGASATAATYTPPTTPTPTPAALVRSRPSRGLQASRPPSSEADVLGLGRDDSGDGRRARSTTTPLCVVVLNGDLKFVPQPLMVGHYRALALTGSEAVINRLVANAMSHSLDLGLYPDATGSHQLFGNQRCNPDNPFEMARPESALVIGLGEEGKLRATELVYTVRQAVLAFAQRLSETKGGAPATFELASTLIGSGGTGITAGSAAQLISQGAREANLRLATNGWPQLSKLTFVELYLDRAGDAWRALKLQEHAAPDQLKLEGKVQSNPGAMRRLLDSSYRGVAYDFISALTAPGGSPATPCITYALDTKRARTEVRAQHAQGNLLRELVAQASNDADTDPCIRRTLFNLLVPVEMEPFLAGSSELVIELDAGTAAIPWELLDTNDTSDDLRPWAIRTKLLRKLRTDTFRAKVIDANPDDNVLVIGEPMCDPLIYPRLDGARREAAAVAARLTAPGSGIAADKVRALIDRNDAKSIINALFERRYRVVHVAGHGEGGADGGVVLSGRKTFLGANEVKSMRTVPELVFLNCCHLGGHDAATTLKPRTYNRAQFAATIAEALIDAGVRCVIAAGWAVEDGPAEIFATSFYASLLGGARFIEAVGVARAAAWNKNPQGNTWAAYQCYGDPEWTWDRQGTDAPRPARAPAEEFWGVASPVSLALALEALAIGSEYGNELPERQLDKLRYLEAEFGPLWGTMGAVAEAFGVAYGSVKAVDQAIDWYRKAIDAQDGSASMRAADQLGNLLVRRAAKLHDAVGIRAGITQLEHLFALQPTIERENLLGSAFKRLTMVEWSAKHEVEAKKALQSTVEHYRAAEKMACAAHTTDLHYPTKNIISAEICAAFIDGRLPDIDDKRLQQVSGLMHTAATEHPDFWSVVGQTELAMLAALAKGQLADEEESLTDKFQDLKARIPATRMWDSVCNEAQFTLAPYIAMMATRENTTEEAAARRLLDALKGMAGQAPG